MHLQSFAPDPSTLTPTHIYREKLKTQQTIMPEVASTRAKRSSTMSKLGKLFGVHTDKEKDQRSVASTPVSPVSPNTQSNPQFVRDDLSKRSKSNNKVGASRAGSKEGSPSLSSSGQSSHLNSVNGSTASLNRLGVESQVNDSNLMKKLNNLSVSNGNELNDTNITGVLNSADTNPGSRNLSSNAIIEENESADADLHQEYAHKYAALTATTSNPNISHSNIPTKTRNNRSHSVSKNNIRSKDSFKENSSSSTASSGADHLRPLKGSRSPRSKNTSEISVHSKDTATSAAAGFSKKESQNNNKKENGKDKKTDSHSKTHNKLEKIAGTATGGLGSSSLNKDKYCGRLKVYEDGGHEHFLKNAKRQEKLSTMIKNFLGAKKLRDESVSAVSNILPNILPDGNVPPSLMSGLMNKVHQNENGKIEVVLENGLKKPSANNINYQMPVPQGMEIQENLIDPRSFAEKYGTCQEVIGRGTFGVVKISHKKVSENKENLYAVKEFRRRAQETEKEYSQRLEREFYISSSLRNIHIIQTLDLLQDAKGDYCEVMEFCTGGDLYTLIVTAGKLEYIEADCFFKQLVRGVSYMHTMGVAHRDIKPENILLTADGNLKITDFGTSECFSYAWESTIHLFQGVIGSAPYIAPELYMGKEYDLRPADVWACGVVYMAMRTGRQLWRSANANEDEFYQEYLKGRKDAHGYFPIESLKRARCRNVIYSILDPVPGRRITAKQILNSEWGREIKCCEAGEHGTKTDNIAVR